MSKLFNKYLELKKEDSSKIYLFKSGIFYIFLDEDAIKVSCHLNLKLTKLNDDILKCGFPVKSLNKYLVLFKQFNLNISIIENLNDKGLSCHNYILNSDVKEIIEILASTNSDNLSISEVYLLIEKLSSKAQEIEKEMNS